MPLYDYRCESCGAFREFRPMSEAGKARPCPVCALPCARTLSAPFLGGNGASGWLTNPHPNAARGSSWRAACGFGCTHANCG
jgi:putative FmdB family regulatory protein